MGLSVDEALGTKVRKLTLRGNHNPVHKFYSFWGEPQVSRFHCGPQVLES